MENIWASAFMVFGLGFFLFVCWTITRDNREGWERKMVEVALYADREDPATIDHFSKSHKRRRK